MQQLLSNNKFLVSSIRAAATIILILSISLHIQAQNHNIILGRPTNNSITSSIMFDYDAEFYLEYGVQPGVYSQATTLYNVALNVPEEVDIIKLMPDTKYYYRMQFRSVGINVFSVTPEYSFHTQRSPGSTFYFTIEADEHLYDKKGVKSLYEITLANEAADNPDFMISLGDIFGDDHEPYTITSGALDTLHRDYRPFLGSICDSVPFYVCLGNHEGENDYYYSINPPNNLCIWGTDWRKFNYPNPYPNGFYTGNTDNEPYCIGNPENYYSWTWGNALFVVLDVYRNQCDTSAKPGGWNWSLGYPQYTWLKNTLEGSTAPYKFVFAHHVRGQGRGGITNAKLFEWGGYDGPGGTVYNFPNKRPGWYYPIKDLLTENHVNIFFHGHDHLFGQQEKDCLIYQETPQPSHPNFNNVNYAASYGYVTGKIIPQSGHLRVTVNPNEVQVDYVRAYIPQNEYATRHNKDISATYFVGAVNCYDSVLLSSPVLWNSNYIEDRVYPNPFTTEINIDFSLQQTDRIDLSIFNQSGQLVRKLITGSIVQNGNYQVVWDGKNDVGNFQQNGLYYYQINNQSHIITSGKIILNK